MGNLKHSKTTVYLIGTGPGDPLLITQKAILILEQAELVLYDFLCHPNLLHHCQTSCKTICVGKRRGQHSHTQDEIHDLILKYSETKKNIVRLKGGSAGIFGRLAEELNFLKKQQLNYQIIPGISTGTAAAELAGLPLTDRKTAHSIAFLTGSLKKDAQQKQIPNADTLVIFMGIKHIQHLVEQILNCGHYDQNTPAIIIYKASYTEEKHLTATLGTIVNKQKKAQLSHPSLIIISKTVALQKKFSWQHTLPLNKQHIILLRRYEQCIPLYNALSLAGAIVSIYPSFTLKQIVENTAKIKKSTLKHYTHIIFTSPNSVTYFFAALFEKKEDTRSLGNCKIISIGEGTNEALRNKGIVADMTANSANSEGLITLIKNKIQNLETKKILLPAAEKTRGLLEKELKPLCETFDKIVLYKQENKDLTYNEFPANSWVLINAKSTLDNLLKLNTPSNNITQQLNALTQGKTCSEAAKNQFKKQIILPNDYKHENVSKNIIQAISQLKK